MIEKGVFIAPVPLTLVGLWATVLFWPSSVEFLGLTITPWTILTVVALAFYAYKSIPSRMNLAPLVEAELTRIRNQQHLGGGPELSATHLFPTNASPQAEGIRHSVRAWILIARPQQLFGIDPFFVCLLLFLPLPLCANGYFSFSDPGLFAAFLANGSRPCRKCAMGQRTLDF